MDMYQSFNEWQDEEIESAIRFLKSSVRKYERHYRVDIKNSYGSSDRNYQEAMNRDAERRLEEEFLKFLREEKILEHDLRLGIRNEYVEYSLRCSLIKDADNFESEMKDLIRGLKYNE